MPNPKEVLEFLEDTKKHNTFTNFDELKIINYDQFKADGYVINIVSERGKAILVINKK